MRVLIGNTESRRRELVEALGAIMESRRMTKQETLRLRGRLQFTSGYLFGRIAKSCLTAVSNHAYSSSTSMISDELLSSLILYKHLLETGRPRELKRSSAETWFIQTDACFDPEHDHVVARIGAVLFAPDGRPMRFFFHKLSDAMARNLNPSNKKSAIYECDFFVFFCSFWLWGDVITDAVVIYTDNNGVRDTLISCGTQNSIAKKILTATLVLESTKQITPWYARVPTDSNLSDGPSRCSCDKVGSTGAVRCDSTSLVMSAGLISSP